MHQNQRDCKEEKMCSSELRVTEQPTELKSPGFDDGKTFTQDLKWTAPCTKLALGLMLCINYTSYNLINLLLYMIYYMYNISICLFYDRSARAG